MAIGQQLKFHIPSNAIKDLGLVTWIDPETSRPSWVVVLRLVNGSYRYLSFFTRDYLPMMWR